jgi:hypothetical protein
MCVSSRPERRRIPAGAQRRDHGNASRSPMSLRRSQHVRFSSFVFDFLISILLSRFPMADAIALLQSPSISLRPNSSA